MKRVFWGGVTLGIAAYASFYIWQFLAIDRCLDDGGVWSHSANKCECSRKQLAEPNVPKEYIAFCDQPGPIGQ